jgi:DNA-binding transcriptional MerR regulator
MDETIKYLQETGLTVEDIHNVMQENAILKNAIIAVQNKINENKSEDFYKADAEQIKEIAQDAKMEIFKLWYLAHTGRKYEE